MGIVHYTFVRQKCMNTWPLLSVGLKSGFCVSSFTQTLANPVLEVLCVCPLVSLVLLVMLEHVCVDLWSKHIPNCKATTCKPDGFNHSLLNSSLFIYYLYVAPTVYHLVTSCITEMKIYSLYCIYSINYTKILWEC